MRIVKSSLLCLALLGSLVPANSANEFQSGVAAYEKKDYVKARTFLEQAAQAYPKAWQPHYYLGHTQLALGAYAKAKYEYGIAQNLCNDPTMKSNCQMGIDQADRLGQSRGGSSASTTTASSPGTSSSGATGAATAPSPGSSAAGSSDVEKRRTAILKQAQEEVAKIRKAAKDQLDTEKANSNEMFRYPDGTIATGVSHEREAEISREADEKCKRIMDDAERKARSLH